MDKKEHGQPPLPIDHEDDRELFDEQFGVASATECTGLMPTPPATSQEVDSYSEIYDVPLPDGQKGTDGKRKKQKKS